MGEAFFFLVSWLLWRVWFSRYEPPANPRAILIIKLDHLGDGILAMPALENLRRYYPNARLDLLCARWNRPAFATNPHINRILEFSPRTFRREGPRDRFSRIWQAFTALRGQYGMVVCLRGTWSTLLLARRCWIDRGALRVEMRLRGAARATHETDIVLSLLEFFEIPVRVREPRYHVLDADHALATDLFERLNVPQGKPLIALHVGSPVPEKRWIPQRYADMANRLIAEGYHVLLLGAPNEETLSREVRELIPHGVSDLTGKTRFSVSAAVLSRCAGFVGNDSAPMHLAAAVGIPTVGLFFVSDPQRFGPRGPCVRALSARVPHALSVATVLETLRDAIQEGNGLERTLQPIEC